MLSTKNIHVGIDLGTTNSTCAVCVSTCEGVAIDQILIRQLVDSPESDHPYGEQEILPSVVWIDGNLNTFTGEYCKNLGGQISHYPESKIVRSIKRRMGTPAWSVKAGKMSVRGVYLHPADIASLILKTIFQSVIEKYPAAGITDVTITIPASFSSGMRQETLRAAELAGFDPGKTKLVDEPLAALFGHWIENGESKQPIPHDTNVLVFDMGGGTLDVSILKINQDEKIAEVLSTSRYNELAGDDLDLQIAALLVLHLQGHPDYNLYFEECQKDILTANAAGVGLLEVAEKLKIELAERLENGPRGGGFPKKLAHYRNTGESLSVDFSLEFETLKPMSLEIPISSLLEALSLSFRWKRANGTFLRRSGRLWHAPSWQLMTSSEYISQEDRRIFPLSSKS